MLNMSRKRSLKTITVVLYDDQMDLLEECSIKYNRSKSEVLREIIDGLVKAEEGKAAHG